MRVAGYIVVGVLCFAALLGLGFATSWFGLVTGRPMAKYAEQTRHEVFQQSAAREEGINKSILSECLSMRSASDPAQKRAMAQFILGDASSYEGHLTAASQACVTEAQGV